MDITIMIYDGFTALDAVGPFEVLSRLPDAATTLVAPAAGPVRTDNRMLTMVADKALADVERTDVLVVPGGPTSGALGEEEAVAEELRRLDASSRATASVCTGALILAAAGVLRGKKTTTHWAFHDALREPAPSRSPKDAWSTASTTAPPA